jgi:hypothetical protein
MKKILFLVVMIVFTIATQAQITPVEKKPVRQTPVKIIPPPPATSKTPAPPPPAPPPPPPPPQSAASDNTEYFLASVKVDILTGNDNKELPSIIEIDLRRLTRSVYAMGADDGTTLLYNYTHANNDQQEFKPNSNNQIVLTNLYTFPYTFPGGSSVGWRYYELYLGKIQTNGLRLDIRYYPNFILDAWKIEKVTLTLEFKDITGKPHPTMATVVVPFLNISALLKDGNNILKCETDKFLLPKN